MTCGGELRYHFRIPEHETSSGGDASESDSEAGTAATSATLAESEAFLAGLDAAMPRAIGRFAVLRRLGAGGMGVVYSAYDERLDRRVAIKLLHADQLPGSRGESRLQREARALARLSHPNVVQVYEVGEHEGRVFIAMEFVEGRTIKEWLRERSRSWQEVVEVYRHAGRGLAAAHAVGLVHRDFKPENVLVAWGTGDRQGAGRVCVLDFGLARPDHGSGARVTLTPQLAASGGERDDVTHAGALLGTPAYMSPEQVRGQPTDARSDQFSFCVALYEALFGARPFAGDNRLAVGMAILEGKVQPPPEPSNVPGWLQRAVLRGLLADPAERHPDLETLLAAMNPERSRSRRLWGAMVGLAVVATGGVFTYAAMGTPEACSGGPSQLAKVWHPERREAIVRAVRGTGAGLAETTAERLPHALDGYGEAWVSLYRDACEATQVRRDQSQALLDLRMACLDSALRHVDELLEVLAEPDVETVEHALTAVAGLPALEACADRAALTAVTPPADADTAARVQELRDALARIRSLRSTGKRAQARDELEPVRQRAVETGYGPLIAEVGYDVGQLALDMGDHESGVEALREAYWTALRHGDDALAFSAASLLVRAEGDLQERFEIGLLWARTAEALLERSADNGHRLRAAWLWGHRGTLHFKQGDYVASRDDLDRAIAIAESSDDLEPRELASLLVNRGNTELALGDLEAAEGMYTRALALREASLGPDHPDNVSSLTNLAIIHHRTGRDEEGIEALSRAAEILERTTGADSVRAGHVNLNLAVLLDDRGRRAEALGALERAMSIYRDRLGRKHPNYAKALITRTSMLLAEDDVEAAVDAALEALETLESALGPRHPDTAHARLAHAAALQARGEHEVALQHYERALVLWEEVFGPEHVDFSLPLLGIGRAHASLDRPEQALAFIERAQALLEKDGGKPRNLADVHMELARVLWTLGHDRERARRYAEQARDVYSLQPGLGRYAEEAEAWLRDRR